MSPTLIIPGDASAEIKPRFTLRDFVIKFVRDDGGTIISLCSILFILSVYYFDLIPPSSAGHNCT